MTYKTLIISSVAILSLAACDGGDKKDDNMIKTEGASAESGAVDTVGSVVEKVKEMVTLDTSSVDAFKSSLSSMKDSLSDEDKGKLTSALGNLAKKAATDKSEGSAMDMAKGIASGGSAEDQIYNSFKDKLSGMNFDDLMGFAG